MKKAQRAGTQKTQPKKGKPIEIPVPTRADVMDALDKAAKPEYPARKPARTH